MRVGQTKTVEWVKIGEPLEPHQKLGQRRDHVMHHNKYQVLTEHVGRSDMAYEFHLTPDMMAAMYDYMRSTKPFVWWKLPPSESVQFHVTKHKLIVGDHVINDRGEHVIRVSTSNVGSTDELARVIAHEMVHAHCDRKGVRSEHGSAFQTCADKVCRFHGFDRKRF